MPREYSPSSEAIFSTFNSVTRAWCSRVSPAAVSAIPFDIRREQADAEGELEIVHPLADGGCRNASRAAARVRFRSSQIANEQPQGGQIDPAQQRIFGRTRAEHSERRKIGGLWQRNLPTCGGGRDVTGSTCVINLKSAL